MRTIRLLMMLCTLLLTPTASGAADRMLLASSLDAHASRAWGVYHNAQGDQLLIFFPPRDAVPEAGTGGHGRVQSVRTLGRAQPRAIAALGDRVYLVYPPVRSGGQRLMRVYTLSLSPGPVGGVWVADPPDRFDTAPGIVTDGVLTGLQATSEGLWALIEHRGSVTLSRMEQDAWVPIELPESLPTKRLQLTALGERPVLVDRSGVRFSAHAYDPETGVWEVFPDAVELSDSIRVVAGLRALSVIDEPEPGVTRLRSWSPAGLFEIAEGIDLPAGAALAALPSSDTLLALARRADGGEPGDGGSGDASVPAGAVGAPPMPLELIELGLMDGAERYRGEPITSTPVSPEELRFLVGMMMLIMAGVLVVVIMPDRSGVMHLPTGMALADPGRRLIASIFDAVLVASVVGYFWDVSASEILTLAVIVRPDNAWAVFPVMVVSGMVSSTLFEWLLGATPGKLLVGTRVVRAEVGPARRPSLASALVRNAIKWLLPPVAALALVDPETLHRGDRVSRTLVVVPRQDLPEAEEG